MYKAEKGTTFCTPLGKQLLELSSEKASARFSLDESIEFKQNIQNHLKLGFIYSSPCGNAGFNFFTHIRKSLETLQAYPVNQDLLDHITKSPEPVKLFSSLNDIFL